MKGRSLEEEAGMDDIRSGGCGRESIFGDEAIQWLVPQKADLPRTVGRQSGLTDARNVYLWVSKVCCCNKCLFTYIHEKLSKLCFQGQRLGRSTFDWG